MGSHAAGDYGQAQNQQEHRRVKAGDIVQVEADAPQRNRTGAAADPVKASTTAGSDIERLYDRYPRE